MTYVTEQTSGELRAHMKKLTAMRGWHDPLADRLWLEVQALDAKVKELQASQAAPASAGKDAEDARRYRWLRDPQTDVALVLDKRTNWVPPDDAVPGVGGYWEYEYRAGDELDAAIDAAIARKESGL